MIEVDQPEDDKIENVTGTVAPNPLLARVELPGSTFQLPSRGLFYTNGELHEAVEMGEVHVNPMSAYDEILMKSPDQLYSGDAVEKVFKRCVRHVLKPKELLAKDVDFLLVCLRQVTYGEEMRITYTHSCEDAKSNEYTIKLSDFLGTTKRLDPTTVGQIYSVKMPNDQLVNLHPSKFIDVIKMFQETEKETTTPEDELNMSIFIIQSIIQSVDGVTDKKHIAEWIKTISAGWLRIITDTVEKTSDFGTDFTLNTKCGDCGKDIEIQAPVNPISFFM